MLSSFLSNTHRWEALAGSHSTHVDSSQSLPAGIFPTEVNKMASVGVAGGVKRRGNPFLCPTHITLSPIPPAGPQTIRAIHCLF